jgi:hypothetical protein
MLPAAKKELEALKALNKDLADELAALIKNAKY